MSCVPGFPAWLHSLRGRPVAAQAARYAVVGLSHDIHPAKQGDRRKGASDYSAERDFVHGYGTIVPLTIKHPLLRIPCRISNSRCSASATALLVLDLLRQVDIAAFPADHDFDLCCDALTQSCLILQQGRISSRPGSSRRTNGTPGRTPRKGKAGGARRSYGRDRFCLGYPSLLIQASRCANRRSTSA